VAKPHHFVIEGFAIALRAAPNGGQNQLKMFCQLANTAPAQKHFTATLTEIHTTKVLS
jgi:hypothetical protein